VYVVSGVRGGGWDARFLLSIPAMILLFVTLYSISMLFAVQYRNAIVVILGTLGVWLLATFLNVFTGRMYELSGQRYAEVNAAAYQPAEDSALQFRAWNRLYRAESQAQAGGSAGNRARPFDGDRDPGEAPETREMIYADAENYEWWGDLFRMGTYMLPKTPLFRAVFEDLAIQIDTRNKLLTTLREGIRNLFQTSPENAPPRDEWDRLAVERAAEVSRKAALDFFRDGLITAAFVSAMIALSCWRFAKTDF
jgi:hypothetical protein